MKLIETKKPPEKKANLLKDHGINNIGKLRALGEQTVENEAQIKQIVKYCNGISKGGLMKMIAACQGAIPGSRPPIASYVNESSPLRALGEANKMYEPIR
jgi:poly(3-hydroxybutyrate) depolymerase